MSNSMGLIITIDGPAGVGKSTVAQMAAKKLNAVFLDTGAMYRALTLAAMRKNINLGDQQALCGVLDNCNFKFEATDNQMLVSIDGTDVTKDIRQPEVTANVRHIASVPQLRCRLVDMQRQFACENKRVVTEGRDQGTIAFPQAKFKFFLTADIAERAQRRQRQLSENGRSCEIEKLRNEIRQRDNSDQSRDTGPLTPAEDAIIIDSTNLKAQQVVKKILSIVNRE